MTSSIEEMVARRKRAEHVVEDMPEGPLREKAFEVTFQHLLTVDAPQPAKGVHRRAAPRAKREKNAPKRPAKKKAAGPQSQLQDLVEEGFFDMPQGLPDIVQHLRVEGYTYTQVELGTPLRRLTTAKLLKRSQESRQDGRPIYMYQRRK